jgi:hypothetical protein
MLMVPSRFSQPQVWGETCLPDGDFRQRLTYVSGLQGIDRPEYGRKLPAVPLELAI